jgi:VWFA-related protein
MIMMRTILRSSLLLLAAGVALQAPLGAQEEPQAQFGETVDVSEVLLDVLVTDAQGNVIIGLGPEDFVVKEDGKPVEITDVTFYSNRRLVESSASVLAKSGIKIDQVPEDRYFILLFDDQKKNSPDAPRLLSQQMEAARRAKGWVEGELSPGDWVAVLSYDTKLKVQQDFTRDQRALIDAIGDAVKGKDPEQYYAGRVPEGKSPSLLAGLPRGKELRDRTPTIFDALQQIARAASNVRGRKNLLLFTNGLPGRLDTFGQYIPDPRYFKPTSQALNDANVAAYTIDLVPSEVEHTLSDSLNQLADETGGRYFFNFVNFSTPLDQITEENNGYYLLAYKSSHKAGEKGFQQVEVETVSREFKVKARKGYEYGG